MKSTTIDLAPMRVDGESFCGCYHNNPPEGYSLSGKHEPVISAVLDWWRNALQGMSNHTDDNEVFIERMVQLVDIELETGGRWPLFVNLGKTGCGCYCGILKDCTEAVLSPEVANVMKRREQGLEPVSAERPFCLPAAFVNDCNRMMYISDDVVVIAKWETDRGFQVEEVVWCKEGVSIPLAIAMEYWMDVAYDRFHLTWPDDTKRSEKATTIATFCECLFQSAGLSVDCVADEVPLSVIGANDIDAAERAARRSLCLYGDPLTMRITSDAVMVTWRKGTFNVWEKD